MSYEVNRPLAPCSAQGVRQGRALRVLVVDDNRDAATCLAWLLQFWGHTVCVASDGPMALEAARCSRPDVVLLDLGLPGMDGYQVAQRLRGADGRGPVLWALTGHGLEEDRRRSQAAGFERHLLKPVDPEVLEMLLAQCEWRLEPDAPAAGDGCALSAA